MVSDAMIKMLLLCRFCVSSALFHLLSQLDALKRSHAEEMAECVREHNKKYSAMLSQQLNEQDKLKSDLEGVHKVS